MYQVLNTPSAAIRIEEAPGNNALWPPVLECERVVTTGQSDRGTKQGPSLASFRRECGHLCSRATDSSGGGAQAAAGAARGRVVADPAVKLALVEAARRPLTIRQGRARVEQQRRPAELGEEWAATKPRQALPDASKPPTSQQGRGRAAACDPAGRRSGKAGAVRIGQVLSPASPRCCSTDMRAVELLSSAGLV